MSRNDRHLDRRRPRAQDRRRARSTPSSSPSPTCRAACRASGCTAQYFLDEVLDARHRGLQLPARRRRRHEHRRRLRDHLVGAGLRRHGVRPRPRHDPAAAPPAGDRDDPVRPGLARPHAGRPVAAVDPQAQVERAAELGYVALAGTELEFIVFEDTYEQALRPRLPRPDAGQPVQRRLLDPRHHPGRAAAARHPQHHVRRRARTSRRAKGECNFGQHEIGFLYDEVVVTADNHAVYKTVAKEIAVAHGKSITFMAKFDEREGNSCHIHLSLRGADGDDRLLGRRGGRADAALRQLRRRRAGHDGGLHAALRAEHQLLQAVRRRLVRADGDRLGRGQPHLRGAAGRPRRRRADGEPGAGRRRQPLPRAGRDAGRRAARHRERAGARAAARGQRLHVRTPAGAADAARGPRRVRTARRSPARPSATRSSTTTRTWPTSSSTAFDAAVTDWELRRGFERL